MKQQPLRLFCTSICVSTLSFKSASKKIKSKNVPKGLFEHSVSSVVLLFNSGVLFPFGGDFQ